MAQEQYTPEERRILKFLADDATFDIVLSENDARDKEEQQAINNLLERGLIRLDGNTYYLTNAGIREALIAAKNGSAE